MPDKKKVTIAASGVKSKDGKQNQGGKSALKKKESALAKELNPIQRSKESIKRAYDVRRTREKYGDKIQSIQEEQENDIKDLIEKIKYYRKENEKLIRNQVLQFGLTLDEMNHVKDQLEQARTMNDTLYQQVEVRKAECDKLQTEMDNIIEKINELEMDKNDLRYEKKMHEAEKVKLEKTESKIQALIKSNRELRSILLHNKINPGADASTMSPLPTIKNKSPRNEPKRVYQESDGRLPVIFNKKNLLGYRSADDMRPKKPAPKQVPLRRSRSYNQSTIKHYMTAQEFFRRRRSDATGRAQQFEVMV